MTGAFPAVPRAIGRYLLFDQIAAGGMATVHLGRMVGHVGFSRTVAIKRLHAPLARDPEFVAMLLDEARLAARIHHHNVVATIDVVAESSELIVVMELIAGESLGRLARATLRAGERVPLGVAMAVLSDALQGLHAAHEATDEQGEPLGLIHRDVSPQNLLVGVDGATRVIDFGVAKASGRSQSTSHGVIKGKLAYMSPEQVGGERIDRRSDLFSAAVVMWEVVCGRRLFAKDNDAATVSSLLSGHIAAPSTVCSDLPPALDALVMKGLARDPASRFQTALEMVEAAEAVPRASSREVAVWVKRFAADTLAQRAARVAEIESASLPGPLVGRGETPAIEPLPSDSEAAGSVPLAPATSALADDKTYGDAVAPVHLATTSSTASRPAGRIALVALVALVACVAFWAVGRFRQASYSHSVAAGPGDATVAESLPAQSAQSAQLTMVPAVDKRLADPAAAAGRDAGPVAPAHPGRMAPAHRKCDPPYTLDSSGIRTPKPECL